MNPAFKGRILRGGFVEIVFPEGVRLSGYAAEDPDRPGQVRLDCLIPDELGYLRPMTLHPDEEDLVEVRFLEDAPEMTDREGQTIRMPEGFWN